MSVGANAAHDAATAGARGKARLGAYAHLVAIIRHPASASLGSYAVSNVVHAQHQFLRMTFFLRGAPGATIARELARCDAGPFLQFSLKRVCGQLALLL